jgi:F-type H+-transporting ATPase subunit alpha
MSTIVEQIENEIASFEAGAVKSNTGKVVSIADGVAKLSGLSGIMYNEMIDFGQGVTGLALNLEEDEVGCVILGDYSKLKEGDAAATTGKLLSVPVGMGLLGRVVDAIGNPIDGKGPINSTETYPASSLVSLSTSRCKQASCQLTR